MLIPKIIHHTWVGPRPAPLEWMNTWREEHPSWEYMLWTEEKIRARKWRTQKHIDFFFSRGLWHGIADLIRYETLHEFGGFNPGADSICLRPIDELFQADRWKCYTPRENETVRPGLVAPIHAAVPGADFVGKIIAELESIDRVGEPWKTTGNLFVQRMIEKHHPEDELKLWPSHYFFPVHYTGTRYSGPEIPFATHIWGTTKKMYHSADENPGKS